jgi:hypothetical protein
MTQTQTLPERTAQQQPHLTVQPPSTDSTATHMVAETLSYCAQKMNLGARSHVLERLRHGDSTACSYCLYSLSKQVAEALGTQDDHIQAVYLFEHDATPQDGCFVDAMDPAPLLHLIVHVSRQTAALNALVAILDRALVRVWADTLDRKPQQSLLDVHVIDDTAVASHMGYGALLQSVHNRPIQIWVR